MILVVKHQHLPEGRLKIMQSPNLSIDENRIAQAVVQAMDTRFVAFENRMGGKFTNYMTEIENHYGQRHNEIITELRALREDYKKVFPHSEGD